MTPQTLLICKGLIEQMNKGQERLVPLLSPSDQNTFRQLPHPAPFEKEHLRWDLLDHIHFSWIAPHMRHFAQGEIPLFLAALSQAHSLITLLGYSNHLPTLTQFAKKALRKLLLEKIVQNQKLTPMAFLPQSPYNILLSLAETKLKTLIRFLGLHDLSFEMRQIISTKELKKIFAVLSKKEGDFLHTLMLHKEPLVFKRLFLNQWDSSKEKLYALIDERGINRLGNALYQATDSFLWYLTHRLEMHQGNLLIKYKEKPVHERGETILQKQIEKILREVS